MPDAHSPFGGSRAYRWLNCPGSVSLIETIPEPPDTCFAHEGRVAHKLAELCLRDSHDALDFVSRFIDELEVTPEMAEAVQVYLDYVHRILAEHPDAVVLVETRFHLTDLDDEFTGKCDCVIYVPSTQALYVIDYKHGAGIVVTVEDNAQAKYYALGALSLHGPIKNVILVVIQPRRETEGEAVHTWETSSFELMEYGAELQLGAARARQKDAELKTGLWCRNCPACAVCPKMLGHAAEAQQFETEDADTASHGGELEPAEVGRRLQLADALELWIRAIRTYAYREAQRARVPEGFKLVKARPRRKWNKPGSVIADLVTAFPFDVSEHDVCSRKPITPRQFELLVGEKYARQFVSAHAAARPSITLVPDDDERDAVLPSAIGDFADLIEKEVDDEEQQQAA